MLIGYGCVQTDRSGLWSERATSAKRNVSYGRKADKCTYPDAVLSSGGGLKRTLTAKCVKILKWTDEFCMEAFIEGILRWRMNKCITLTGNIDLFLGDLRTTGSSWVSSRSRERLGLSGDLQIHEFVFQLNIHESDTHILNRWAACTNFLRKCSRFWPCVSSNWRSANEGREIKTNKVPNIWRVFTQGPSNGELYPQCYKTCQVWSTARSG